jgi:hypothetical protein
MTTSKGLGISIKYGDHSREMELRVNQHALDVRVPQGDNLRLVGATGLWGRQFGQSQRWSLPYLLRRRAKASSIRILRSQLRNAPSCSNCGGLREALRQQLFTASSALSSPPSTRHAMKWSSPRQRENLAANTCGCSHTRFEIVISSHTGTLSTEFSVINALSSRSVTVRAAT